MFLLQKNAQSVLTVFYGLVLITLPMIGYGDDRFSITYKSELWSITQLDKAPSGFPKNNMNFHIFPITKSSSNTWIVGGRVSEPDTEFIFVDRVNRKIGPYASDSIGNCAKSKRILKKELAETKRYSACRSVFYTSWAPEKIAQATIMCALIACLGGYTTDWIPAFRPSVLKEILNANNLLQKFEKNLLYLDQVKIDQAVAKFTKSTNRFKAELSNSSPEEKTPETLQEAITRIQVLTLEYDQMHSDAQKQLDIPASRAFSLNTNQINRIQQDVRKDFETLKKSVEIAERDLKTELLDIERKIALDRERKKQEQIAVIKQIQEVLTSLGYYYSNVDGVLGPGTEEAIDMAFDDFDGETWGMTHRTILSKLEEKFLDPKETCQGSSQNNFYSICLDL